ncbi:DUF362 domain-containing protein [bacterium]|nr:DUF362 domain-containing protein [bacterium]
MLISRRDFIKGGAAALSSSLFFQRCDGKQIKEVNLRQNKKLCREGNKSKIIVVNGENFEKNLEQGLDCVGNLKSLFPSDAKIIIKPNFVTAEPYPATTDTRFILAVSKRLKDSGFSNIKIVDCSHISSFEFNGIIEKSANIGIQAQFCEPNNLTLYTKVVNPKWKCFDKLMIQKDILDADVVISLPVLKRHNAAGLTCALKNQMGSVNGSPRYYAHGRYKIGNRGFFMDAIAEFADAVRPDLTIVDARDILIRSGPSLASGQIKNGINKLLIASDMVALDSYCTNIMETHDTSFSSEIMDRTLSYAAALGLGTKNLGNILINEIAA